MSQGRPRIGRDESGVGTETPLAAGVTEDRGQDPERSVREAGEIRRRDDHRGVLVPLVVVDRLPHVEEDRRVLEQLRQLGRRVRVEDAKQLRGQRRSALTI